MRILLLLLVLVTAGCSVVKTVDTPLTETDWAERSAVLAAAPNWSFSGRLGVKDLIAGEATQANLRWVQDADATALRLSGPFGSGASEVLLTPRTLRVIDGDGEEMLEYSGSDAAERFLDDQLGWSFPADSTRYWVRGLADPAAPADLVFGDDGLLASIAQHGWQIAYDRYSIVASGISMPTRLEMQSERARLRIVISKWQIPGASE